MKRGVLAPQLHQSWVGRVVSFGMCLLACTVGWGSLEAALVGPHFLGSIPKIAGTGANRIFVQGTFAYVAAGTNGLVILDIANPDRPSRVGSLASGGSAVDVCVRGSLAFVAFAATGRDAGSLQLIDVTDPSRPHGVGSRRGDTLGVAATETHVYIAAGVGGLLALEYSNPSKPTVTGGFDTPRNATSARLFDNRLYVTDSFAGLYLFDLTDPGKPARVGTYDSPGYLGDVWVKDHLAYLADGASGLSIVDLFDPASPKLVGRVVSAKFANRVLVSGNLAYVATGTGWYAVDVTQPAEPVIRAVYQMHAGIADAVAVGERFLVIDADGGFGQFADNPRQVSQALDVMSPMLDPGIGFAALVPVEIGTHALQVRPDLESPWVTRVTFGSANPGVRRVIDSTSATRVRSFYRVVRTP